jgi:hypothetical protein
VTTGQPIYRVQCHGITVLATAIDGTEYVAPLGTPPAAAVPGAWKEYTEAMADGLEVQRIHFDERMRERGQEQ